MPFHLLPSSFRGGNGISRAEYRKIRREQARVASIIKLGSECSAASEGTGGHSRASKVSGGVRL